MLHLLVAHRRPLTDQIVELELRRPEGGHLPPFTAGAHLDVHVAPGMVRQYSLCQSEAERAFYRIAVLREPASRGGSAGVHEHLAEGAIVEVSEPRNHFPLERGADRSILVGGGIGITPIYAMAEALSEAGAAFELHYCVRSPAHAAFAARLANASFADKVQLHCDDGAPVQRFDVARVLDAPKAGAHLYVCGPGGFMDWILGSARSLGWADANVHREYFSPPADADVHEPGAAFTMKLVRSGVEVSVGAEETAIEALRRVGVEIETSCEQGVCGTCVTRVLAGEPDHRDFYLTDEEHARNDQFTPCCSRARTPILAIDL